LSAARLDIAGSLRDDHHVDVPAVVTAYDPRWPGLFEVLRDRADAALAGVAHATEHVGSGKLRSSR
jgi:GrpB-like predicted nucleotidyltransferase (UPF0157 family)